MSSWPVRWACRLVEGPDLLVEAERVFMRTTGGLRPVHTIYRRISDEFLDPTVFRPGQHVGRARG